MEFEWDQAKHALTVQERGIGFDSASRIFQGRVVMWKDDRHDYGEARFRAVGEMEGAILHVVFTWRGVASLGAAWRGVSFRYGAQIGKR
jgi:uncharacterized DUF497 family protein